jgi:hypothetical protein
MDSFDDFDSGKESFSISKPKQVLEEEKPVLVKQKRTSEEINTEEDDDNYQKDRYKSIRENMNAPPQIDIKKYEKPKSSFDDSFDDQLAKLPEEALLKKPVVNVTPSKPQIVEKQLPPLNQTKPVVSNAFSQQMKANQQQAVVKLENTHLVAKVENTAVQVVSNETKVAEVSSGSKPDPVVAYRKNPKHINNVLIVEDMDYSVEKIPENIGANKNKYTVVWKRRNQALYNIVLPFANVLSAWTGMTGTYGETDPSKQEKFKSYSKNDSWYNDPLMAKQRISICDTPVICIDPKYNTKQFCKPVREAFQALNTFFFENCKVMVSNFTLIEVIASKVPSELKTIVKEFDPSITEMKASVVYFNKLKESSDESERKKFCQIVEKVALSLIERGDFAPPLYGIRKSKEEDEIPWSLILKDDVNYMFTMSNDLFKIRPPKMETFPDSLKLELIEAKDVNWYRLCDHWFNSEFQSKDKNGFLLYNPVDVGPVGGYKQKVVRDGKESLVHRVNFPLTRRDLKNGDVVSVSTSISINPDKKGKPGLTCRIQPIRVLEFGTSESNFDEYLDHFEIECGLVANFDATSYASLNVSQKLDNPKVYSLLDTHLKGYLPEAVVDNARKQTERLKSQTVIREEKKQDVLMIEEQE